MTNQSDHLQKFQQHHELISWNEDDFKVCSLSPKLTEILHVAALLEEDTVITLRQAKSFRVNRSADLAAFFPAWGTEEAEHARALRAVLDHQKYEVVVGVPAKNSRRRRLVALLPAQAIGRLPQVPFVFCVLGAASEYVATSLYSELSAQSESHEVALLLRAIARQEARHFRFFLTEARLQGEEMSKTGGYLSRRVLRAVWEPIGLPTLGKERWTSLFAEWIHDRQLRHKLEMMDRIVDSIPHLGGMRLMESFLEG